MLVVLDTAHQEYTIARRADATLDSTFKVVEHIRLAVEQQPENNLTSLVL